MRNHKLSIFTGALFSILPMCASYEGPSIRFDLSYNGVGAGITLFEKKTLPELPKNPSPAEETLFTKSTK